MGRLVLGIELLIVVVALAALSTGSDFTPLVSLPPLAFTVAVPLLGGLMIWKVTEVAAAFRDAFSTEWIVRDRSMSLRIWVFFERGAYLGGILGVLVSVMALLSRIGQPGSVSTRNLWTAVGLFGLYAVLFGTMYRILRGIVDVLSKKPMRELDLTLSPAFKQRYSLTERECDVIALILRGRRYREVAEELFISIKTVKTHVYHVYEKTSCRGRVDLIRLLQFNGD